MMFERKHVTHPSNTIQEATSFPDALNRLILALQYERDLFDNDPWVTEPYTDKAFWNAAIGKAVDAANIYHRHMQTAHEAVIAELRAKGDDECTMMADALESGDYGLMAF